MGAAGRVGTSPSREKRRRIILLRSVLLFAVGGLVLVSGIRNAGFGAVALLVVFALSNIALLAVPLRRIGSLKFELLVGAADLLLVGIGFHISGASSGVLPISSLLMVLVVAIGYQRAHAVAGAAAVGAIHTWLVVGPRASPSEVGQLAMQMLFLCSVALYYGFMAGGIHQARRRAEGEQLERRELLALLEILETISSSLDLRQVARTIVSRIATIIPAVRCSILLINESRKNCFVMASHDNPDLNMLEIDLEKYPEIRKAIETRSPVLIPDVATDPLMAEVRGQLNQLDFHSIMVVPLTFGEDVLGTLCLKTARADQEFSPSELHFFNAVANASANALKNALLHHKVSEQSRCHRVTGEKLASILDHSPDLILSTDNRGILTEFNRGAERLLGHVKPDVIGEHYTVLLADPLDPGLIEQVCAAGTLSGVPLQLRRRDGSERDLELNMAAVENERGEFTGTVWLGRDVTDLKSAQMQLLQAEKLSSIGEVISGVAHELNNPLSGVLGYSQLLMMRHAQSPLIGELEKINESAVRCRKIVRNLLSFARGHKPERKPLGINGIIQKTLDIRKYQLNVNNVEVVTEMDSDLPSTMVDYYQFQQVFLNLVNNAQHAMATTERPGCLLIRTAHEEGVIRIEITDNGVGMDPATLGRIFEPFFTTKEQGEGTGLGLSVSYGIVKEHGGRIYARSRRGQGSTFVIELPALQREHSEPADVPDESSATISSTSRGGSVLIVDDEPLIIDLLFSVFSDAGYEVDTAAHGVEACSRVEARRYDAVIVDVRMPRMNGIDLYRRILEMRPEMDRRIIFITGDLIDESTIAFLAETDAPSLPKPLDLNKIVQAVEDIVNPCPLVTA